MSYCFHCLSGNQAFRAGSPWVHDVDVLGGKERVVCDHDWDWMDSISSSETYYQRLIAKGWRPQRARSVMPNALAAKLVMTGNLRSWRHFLRMRSTKEAHPQIREVVDPLLFMFQRAIPILYDDLEPGVSQAHNVRLPC